MVRTKHRIGGYRVIAPIGAGGFATVYRALNESSGQEVAIKVLAENHSLVADTRRRFVDEVGLLSTIDSPTIAKIYEVGETETGQPYMVLELADRGDLRRRLEEIRGSHQVLNRADLTMLAHHLYDSLNTLHRAEIVHRDVSPSNILIRTRRAPGQQIRSRDGGVTLLEPGERFLLTDLGHAKDMIRGSGFTAGGGTRGFASPEQQDDITVVDRRTDIFSATAILEWAAHDGEFAADLEPFFDIGLAAEPDERFSSMTDWHNAFSDALGSGTPRGEKRFLGLSGLWRSRSNELGQDHPDGTERSKRRARLLVPAVLVIAATAAVGFAVYRSGAGSDGTSAEDSANTTEASTSGFRGAAVSVPDTGGDPLVVIPDEDESVPTTTVPGSAPVGTDDLSLDGPMADVDTPVDGAVVDGDLDITGSAMFPDGVGSVEIAVTNLETEGHWDPNSGEFQPTLLRFKLPIKGDAHHGAWRYSIPGDQLEAGLYLIRVWAMGADGAGDHQSDSHAVLVS